MGKGAFEYKSGGSGMSCSKRLTTTQGKMKTSHNVVPKSPMGSTNMNMDSTHKGGYMIGEGVRTFRSCLSQQSGIKNDTRHASQPKGHKKDA